MKKVFLAVMLGASSLLMAQAPAGSHEIPVKSSPAEDELVKLAQQKADTEKAFNDLLQQARTNLDKKNKPLVEQMQKRAKVYQDKIELLNKDLKAQADKNTADASAQFQKETAGLSASSVNQTTIDALVNVVKKEQSLPEGATFDSTKKVWTVPGPAPTDAKK